MKTAKNWQKWLFCTLVPSAGFVARYIASRSKSNSVTFVVLIIPFRIMSILKLCVELEIVHFFPNIWDLKNWFCDISQNKGALTKKFPLSNSIFKYLSFDTSFVTFNDVQRIHGGKNLFLGKNDQNEKTTKSAIFSQKSHSFHCFPYCLEIQWPIDMKITLSPAHCS